jgi:GDP-4-dehydro-6-deoxy-D-mannose reductase
LRILITGVNGFVGAYMAKYLQQINELTVFGTIRQDGKVGTSLLENNIRIMDIINKSQIKSVLADVYPNYIIHLAAQSSVAASWVNPQDTMSINVNGTLNLLDCVKEMQLQTRVLLIGSCEEYGSVEAESQPINELQALHPLNPYAVSKTTQNLLAQLYVKSYGMDILTVRSFNQIGAGQDPKFVISYFAKRIAEIENNKTDNILKVGNLDAIRDVLDVRDAITAYWAIMQKGRTGEIYNVGSGKGYKIADLLQILISLSTISVHIKLDPDRIRPTEVPISICDNKKIKNLLDWQPSYNLESSLEDILNYWRKRTREEV